MHVAVHTPASVVSFAKSFHKGKQRRTQTEGNLWFVTNKQSLILVRNRAKIQEKYNLDGHIYIFKFYLNVVLKSQFIKGLQKTAEGWLFDLDHILPHVKVSMKRTLNPMMTPVHWLQSCLWCKRVLNGQHVWKIPKNYRRLFTIYYFCALRAKVLFNCCRTKMHLFITFLFLKKKKIFF